MPIYGIEAAAKAVTAVASITTAVSLWTLIPSALALPSPRRLTEANDALLHRIQERDDALKRLQEANRLLLLAEEMAKAGHWRLELPARNRVWSAGMRKIFGLADGSPVPNLAAEDNGYHEDDRDLVRAQLEAAIVAKTPFTFEARILRPDGSCRTISARGVSKFDSEGAVRALFGVALDITELKQTEAKLRLRERQLQAVLDNMPALIGYWDQHLCNRLANSKYLDWYGKDPAAFLGHHIRDVIGEKAYMTSLPYIEGALRGEQQIFERRIASNDGEDRVTLGTFVPDVKDGKVDGFFALLIDITDRKRAEDRLRASEAFLDRVGRVAGIGGWEILLPNGKLEWSEQTRRIHEVDKTFVPDFDTAIAFYEPAARDLVQNAFDKAVATGVPWDLEVPLTTARGRSIWVRTAGEVEVIDGGVLRVFGVFQDITERKLIERDREIGVVMLEQARSAAEEALREAKKASEAKSEFLATMSHEIRTPLNSIVGFTDLLMESRDLTRDDKRAVELVQSSAAALLTIVNDVLDFSKLEAGQCQLQYGNFFLHDLLTDAVAIMSGVAERKGLEMSLEIASDVPTYVVGDENRLRQILLNLLGNATKFTAWGSIQLLVEVPDAAGQSEVRFTVKDTGIGIPRERLDVLFKRFSQVDGSIGRRFGGTGLGLAICDELVKLMDGEIGVRSEEGWGSSFWFRIPLPKAAPPSRVAELSTKPRLGPGGRVLVVEDIVVNQELARRILASGGHEVDVVSSGIEAIQRVQESDYDIVFMDIQMPGMDGIATTTRIRALEHPMRGVPIYAMTAYVLPRQILMFEKAGMDGHVAKPVKREELLSLVERTIGARSQPSSYCLFSFHGLDKEVAGALAQHIGDTDFSLLAGDFFACLENLSIKDRKHWNIGELIEDIKDIMNAAGSLGFMSLYQTCAEIEGMSVEAKRLETLLQRLNEECGTVLQNAEPEEMLHM